MKSEHSVGIIIVNWNGKEDTIELIDSINNIVYKNYEIFLVDNDSSDGSQKYFKKRYKSNKKINLIFNKENLGLAGGYNSGLKEAMKKKTKYSFIMNNDMVVDKNFLGFLVDEMKKDSNLAAVGPRIYYYDEKDRIWSTGVKFRLRGFENIDQNKKDEESFQKKTKVDALDGAYLIRNSFLEEIGIIEKDFFIMHEMTGWCIKAKSKGYVCLINPKSKIWHKVSRSVKKESKICAYYGARNWILLLKRTQKNKFVFGIIFYALLIFPRMIKSILKGNSFLFKEKMKGFLDSFFIN